MFIHETKLRTRYGETDQMGYVYYGNYAEYFEVARVEMLRSLGMSYSAMEAAGVMMPVLELNCKYIKPVYYDEHITIKTSIKELPTARIYFEYEIFNEAAQLVHIGKTTLVFVDMATKRPTHPPVDFMDKLAEFF